MSGAMSGEEPDALRFRASLAQSWDRPARLDGARGPRVLLLTYHTSTSEASLHEHHPPASGLPPTTTLVSRRRVDDPKAAARHSEQHRFSPGGQGVDLAARLHWPKLDCVLRPEALCAACGEILTLWSMPLQIVGPADDVTRTWLRRRGVHLPVAPPAFGAAAERCGGGDDGAPLPFFLGGPRPYANVAPRSLEAGESGDDSSDDECVRARRVAQSAPRPPLRDGAPVRSVGLDPAEARRLERARRFGERSVVWRAAGVGSRLGRRYRLRFHLADETFTLEELSQADGSAGGQYGGPPVASTGVAATAAADHSTAPREERYTLLRRCRCPRATQAAAAPAPFGVSAAPASSRRSRWLGLNDVARVGCELTLQGTPLRLRSLEPSSREYLRGELRMADDIGEDEEPWPLQQGRLK